MDRLTAAPPMGELEDRILPWSQIRVICGLSRTTVWRLQKSGDFPACVQVSRNRVGWRQSEILEWKRSRTPRRLPAPCATPVRPDTQPTPVPPDGQQAAPAPSTQEAVAPSRERPVRRRKSSVAENQTAFDFGG